ncbi:MAG: four helix bundle protein [Taibaiella sp.]|nr:four helix bundle protein [Taibaiella sp.]
MNLAQDPVERPYNIRHRCFLFAKEVVEFIKAENWDYVYRSMFDQLLRSATSIGANVVEGKAGSSKKDWVRFLTIALKSANETKYWSCLIRDTMMVDQARINELITEADEISRIIAAVIINANKKE